MIDFLELADSRRSVREFSDTPVEFDDLLYILNCALAAPSAGDLQPWEFILVTDKHILNQIVDQCPNQEWMSTAPTIIAVVGDMEKMNTYYRDFAESWLLQSCSAAIENMLLGATDCGLGACWVSSFVKEAVSDVLELPSSIQLISLVAVGRSTEGSLREKQVRPLDQIVSFDTYGTRSEDLHLLKRDYSVELDRRREQAREQIEKAKEQSAPALDNFKDRIKDLFPKKRR